jgi:hypothetical protein
MFGKAKCKLCGDEVRLALKHLRDKHGEIYRKEVEVGSKIKMSRVMKKYFFDY